MIRATLRRDDQNIDGVLRSAFVGPDEANLVEQLREGGHAAHEFVLSRNDEIFGYVMYSNMAVPERALGLGPMAISPTEQGKGHGRDLLIGSLATLFSGTGPDYIFVLGEPDFYGKAGFKPADRFGFTSPWPASHFMVYTEKAPTLSNPEQRLIEARYAPPFYML